MNIVSYQINGITGIILEKMSRGVISVKGTWQAEEQKERERRTEEEEREQTRCQGFPVQYTETRANTTIRMSEEIVK